VEDPVRDISGSRERRWVSSSGSGSIALRVARRPGAAAGSSSPSPNTILCLACFLRFNFSSSSCCSNCNFFVFSSTFFFLSSSFANLSATSCSSFNFLSCSLATLSASRSLCASASSCLSSSSLLSFSSSFFLFFLLTCQVGLF